jgi:hypothetical protein
LGSSSSREGRAPTPLPAKRWAEQDPARVTAWIEHDYPAIQARAAKEGAKILWADEMGLRTGQTAGTSYAPLGQRAVTSLTGKRFSVNIISAIGNDGTLLFDVFAGYGDEIAFMDFCDNLIAHHPDRKIFLIVDNHSMHKPPPCAAGARTTPRSSCSSCLRTRPRSTPTSTSTTMSTPTSHASGHPRCRADGDDHRIPRHPHKRHRHQLLPGTADPVRTVSAIFAARRNKTPGAVHLAKRAVDTFF